MHVYLSQARETVRWAASTLTRHGCTLYATEPGWDIELPDGSWLAANDWRELAAAAKAVKAGKPHAH